MIITVQSSLHQPLSRKDYSTFCFLLSILSTRDFCISGVGGYLALTNQNLVVVRPGIFPGRGPSS